MVRSLSMILARILFSVVASSCMLCRCALAESAAAPAVYSAERLVVPKQLAGSTLNSLLTFRDYRNTASLSHPGEFSTSQDSTIIITRAYNLPVGDQLQLVPPLRLAISTRSGDIRNQLGPPLTQFTLEPQLIQNQPELNHFRALALTEARALRAEAQAIFTGLNLELQGCARSSMGGGVPLPADPGKIAFVAIDPITGLIAGWWQNTADADLVMNTLFPRAGLLKPFILYAALSSLTPPTALTPLPQPSGSPGETLRLRDVVLDLDSPYYNELAKQLDSDSLRSVLKRVDAVREDGSPVSSLSPLHAARLLSFLATLGEEVTLRAVTAVIKDDTVTRPPGPSQHAEKLDASATFLVNHLLGVPEAGSGALTSVELTTTTGDGGTSWFAAVSPSRISVLVGDRSRSEMAQLWKSYQSCAARVPPDSITSWPRPVRLEEVQVDLDSGLRADARCRGGEIVSELFLPGTAPTEYCVSQGRPGSSVSQGRVSTKRKRGFWRSLKDSATGIFK